LCCCAGRMPDRNHDEGATVIRDQNFCAGVMLVVFFGSLLLIGKFLAAQPWFLKLSDSAQGNGLPQDGVSSTSDLCIWNRHNARRTT
jgi:hypothetical protein